MKQRSEKWFKAREYMMTASRALTIATNGKGLESYIKELILNKTKNFSNEHTERGIVLEPEAIKEYQCQNFLKVKEAGFLTNYKHEQAGASPDGLVGKDGLVEVKCLIDKKYIKFMLDREIERAYLYQMQMQMMIIERDWCDYAMYNKNFTNCLSTERVYPDNKIRLEIELGLKAGRRIFKRLTN